MLVCGFMSQLRISMKNIIFALMVSLTLFAQEIMIYGAYGSEALQMLTSFQSLYERNVSLANQ